MSRTLALFLSYVLHPALIPTLGVAGIMALTPHYIQSELYYLVILIVFVGTYLFPLLSIFALWRLKIVQSMHLETAEERRFPYVITALLFYLCAQTLRGIYVPELIVKYLLAGVLVLGITILLLKYSKISAHLAGFGGLLALGFYISFEYSLEMLAILSAIILLSGLLGAARLKLEAHTSAQIYLGFFIGLLGTLAVLYFV